MTILATKMTVKESRRELTIIIIIILIIIIKMAVTLIETQGGDNLFSFARMSLSVASDRCPSRHCLYVSLGVHVTPPRGVTCYV